MSRPVPETDFEDKVNRCVNALEVAACVVVSMVDGAAKELSLTGEQRNTMLFAIYEAQDRAAEMRKAYEEL